MSINTTANTSTNKIHDNFKAIGALSPWIEGLAALNISVPTPIQASTFQIMAEGRDIVAQAMTGTGKTFAYLLPILQQIDISKRDLQMIVLAPTHELSLQIHEQIRLLCKASKVELRSQALIGGVKIQRQLDGLKEKPHVVVGSAGRMLELIRLKKLKPHTVKTIVLDEGDKLMEDAHREDVTALIKTTLRDRQLVLFSASLSEQNRLRAEALMKNPERIVVDANVLNPLVSHGYWLCDTRKKVENIRKLVSAVKPERCLIFVNKNEIIQEVTQKLKYHHYKATCLFGNQSKAERAQAMQDFVSGRANLLVTSEMASRGLDIKGVTHVINLDMPLSEEDYMHRIGRTGRHGDPGEAISIIGERELPVLERYVNKFNVELKNVTVRYGEVKTKEDSHKVNRGTEVKPKFTKRNKADINKGLKS